MKSILNIMIRSGMSRNTTPIRVLFFGFIITTAIIQEKSIKPEV